MKIALIFLGLFLAVVALFLLPDLMDLWRSDLDDYTHPEYNIPKETLEDSIQSIKQFDKVELSFSILMTRNDSTHRFDHYKYVQVEVQNGKDIEEKDVDEIGRKVNNLIYNYLINRELFSGTRVVFDQNIRSESPIQDTLVYEFNIK